MSQQFFATLLEMILTKAQRRKNDVSLLISPEGSNLISGVSGFYTMLKYFDVNFFFCFLAVFLSARSFGQKIQTVYLTAGDSAKNMYIIVYPPKLPWKAYMFLIPRMFQKAQGVLVQTDLPVVAARQGIVSIIPTFKREYQVSASIRQPKPLSSKSCRT